MFPSINQYKKIYRFCFNNFYYVSHVNISIMSISFKENLIFPINKNIFYIIF